MLHNNSSGKGQNDTCWQVKQVLITEKNMQESLQTVLQFNFRICYASSVE